jgi:hypothetical protein
LKERNRGTQIRDLLVAQVHATVLSAVQLDPEIALSPGAGQALIEHRAPPQCRAAALPATREPDPAQEEVSP